MVLPRIQAFHPTRTSRIAVTDLGYAEQERIERVALCIILLGDCRCAKSHLWLATRCGVLGGTAGMRHHPE